MAKKTLIATGDKIKDTSIVVIKGDGILHKLTDLQEKHVETVRKFWLDYIMSCKNSLNREKATHSIEWLYKFCGLNKPIIVFVDSPMACQYAVPLAKAYINAFYNIFRSSRSECNSPQFQQVGQQVGQQVWQQVEQQVEQQVWQQVRQQVEQQVEQQVGQQVWQQVGQQVGQQVWQQVGQQVWQQVEQQVEQQVWQQVRQQVEQQVWQQVEQQVRQQVEQQVEQQVRQQDLKYEPFSTYGNVWDYGWVSFYDFFTQIGVAESSDFNQFKELLLSGIYDMIQLNECCIISGLPSKIYRDTEDRLHNIEGPAIEFADGYKQYYIHGRHIDAEVFERAATGKLTREHFVNEQNDEIRSAYFEILGSERLMMLLGAQLVDSTKIVHKNGEIETIEYYRTKEKLNTVRKEPYAWRKVICPSTGTTYFTPTNPKLKTAIEVAKFHRPEWVPGEIDYSWYSRS